MDEESVRVVSNDVLPGGESRIRYRLDAATPAVAARHGEVQRLCTADALGPHDRSHPLSVEGARARGTEWHVGRPQLPDPACSRRTARDAATDRGRMRDVRAHHARI